MKLKHQKALVALTVGCGTAAFSALNLTFAAAPQRAGHSGTSSTICTGKSGNGKSGGDGHCTTGTTPTVTPTPSTTTPTATPTVTAIPTATPTPTTGYGDTSASSGTSSGTKAGNTPSTSGLEKGDVTLLEGALGRTLTDAEKTAIAAAVLTRDATIKAALADFKTQVASLFGLSESDLDTAAQSCGKKASSNLVSVLGTALGRALTDAEKSELATVVATRDAALKATTEAFRTTVATSLGLTIAELDVKINIYRQTQSGRGGGHRAH